MSGNRPPHRRGERPQGKRPLRRNPLPPQVERRLRELDAQEEPLSLAEEISKESRRVTHGSPQPELVENQPKIVRTAANDAGSATTSSPANRLSFAELQRLSDAQLEQVAIQERVEPAGLNRQELVFQILKSRLRNNGLMFGEGTLEILPDGFGFLRSSGAHYVSCPDDIYVSPSQIRRFRLQTGATVAGQIRPPKENERYFALLRVEAINFQDPEQRHRTKLFDELTPLHPDQRIVMETEPEVVETRVIDLVAPIGFGQRGLIVSPPRAGKTLLMQKMARAVLKNYPNAYVFMLLIDERPEEVTDMLREVQGPNCEVISSTFDEHTSRHVQVANITLEKSKRMVETGRDVVIFLDSITRFARAWNNECLQSGKLMTGGLDANALQRPKSFFGSARKVEEGGSLTIIATALVDTGSRMDDIIFEEFKGTGNMEIVLDRTLVDRRLWPAVDINATGTRREEALMHVDEYQRISALRRSLAELNPCDAMETLVNRLKKTKSNAEFLLSLRV